MESRALIVGALTAALPFMLGTVSSTSSTWGLVTAYLGAVSVVALFKKHSSVENPTDADIAMGPCFP
ncbi:hypothetical protein [Glycomyces tritici]|uniref:Uncharacterized protein n=1 Tax=Glycomyces tritici TaxID=2665176 RepID=A0ABT7YWM4_9ACTN|nr:hypothetical protein [Glycomyces tritici]MDN3243046.1 hypothetical protein [Glycomyces tritici]